MTNAKNRATPPKAERRKYPRRKVLGSFSLFVSVPKKGGYRLPIHDLSEEGIGFELDIEGESWNEFPVKKDETVEIQLYLNQSLYIPLTVRVVRIEEQQVLRKIGAEFVDLRSAGVSAVQSFLKALDQIASVVRFDS